MTPRILSQAGKSLADVYDVVGSVAGIDELHSREVHLSHDMASTIFSERMASRILQDSTPTTTQSDDFDSEILLLPATPFRIHGITIFNGTLNTVARLANLVIVMRDELNTNDTIVWMWDGTVEIQRLEGAAKEVLMPEIGFAGCLPSIGMGGDQPATVGQMFARGDTLAFGAGDITLGIRTHISFSQLEGVSSVGLPIPSW